MLKGRTDLPKESQMYEGANGGEAYGLARIVHSALGPKICNLECIVNSCVARDVAHAVPSQIRRLSDVDERVGADIVTRS